METPLVVNIAQWSRLQSGAVTLQRKWSWHQKVPFPLICVHVAEAGKQCGSLRPASQHHLCKQTGRFSLWLLAR